MPAWMTAQGAGLDCDDWKQAAIARTTGLITQYIDSTCDALRHLAACPDAVVSAEVKREFFERAQVCYGRSALLSS